jgi:hypothetical protein
MGSRSSRVLNFLSLPRTGTHFLWSRLVASGQYQLIYDADRIPALTVLREHYDKPIEFLYPPPLNPNYNFQYNSVSEAKRPLTADEHLALLSRKYRCGNDPEELFHRIMSHQDNGDRTLFSINRFVYTCRYEHPFKDFVYTIDMAAQSLERFEQWLANGPYEHRSSLLVREIDEWVKSQLQMYRRDGDRFVRPRLEDFPQVMATCERLGIRVFDTAAAIATIKTGELEYDSAMEPLPQTQIDRLKARSTAALVSFTAQHTTGAMFRPGRFMQYVSEKDAVKRLSLVRSIGWLPVKVAPVLPVLGRMIRKDYEGVVLDNARIDLGSTPAETAR